ncbi:putative sugar O-methyltransferase [Magnetospirillum gryphiswaldense]|uniref:putative sugar O-methyltransferase n=1 Tax=Magnetospirillum gryphiswaldense TaxID=55518 RepID=UPI001319F784|nr:putative sugar O-methyltransferase [Magnetospirillum gryphiswaldense]
MNTPVRQIADDISLLDMMMSELRKADPIYQPTPYWAYYEALVVEELKRSGLSDFRAREGSWGGAFGSTELLPPSFLLNLDCVRLLSNKYTRRIPGWRDMLHKLSAVLSRQLCAIPHAIGYGSSVRDLQMLSWHYVNDQARQFGAPTLDHIGTDTAGNPQDVFVMGDHSYTMQFLKFYWRYVWSCQWIDYKNAKIIVELGSGMGSQAEIFHKLHPQAAVVLFDLPPQLYVAERYLDTVFPGKVVSFRQTRSIKDLSAIEPGKIYMFGNWEIPMLGDGPVDVFWNARSLGETEPEVVANYLSLVTKSCRWVYLNQVLGGQTLLSSVDGPGVRRRTLWSDYETAMQDYQLLGRRPSLQPYQPTSTLREFNSYADEAVWMKPTV